MPCDVGLGVPLFLNVISWFTRDSRRTGKSDGGTDYHHEGTERCHSSIRRFLGNHTKARNQILMEE